MKPTNRIGFMQGRLTVPEGDRIQSFPSGNWQEEFFTANKHGFQVMEWVFEATGLEQNPLWTAEGVREIEDLSKRTGVLVESVVADYFMEYPLFQRDRSGRQQAFRVLMRLIDQCAMLHIRFLEIPLVDASSLRHVGDEEVFVRVLAQALPTAKAKRISICLETDLPPQRFRAILDNPELEGVLANYDMGNSASLRYKPDEEIAVIGDRIGNVHVKDRLLGGGTVPLGQGNVDFLGVLRALKKADYRGSYILQTARQPGQDVLVACHYRDMVQAWLGAVEEYR